MKIARCILASSLLFAPNAWAELEVLNKGIDLAPAAKPADRATGYVWRGLKNGEPHTTTLVSQTGSTETYKESNGCTWSRPKGFYGPGTEWANCPGFSDGSARVRFDGGQIFPLQVGNEWSYYVDAGNWQTERNCEVEDAVRVKTGIGVHDTFKVVCTDKWNTRTRYYSPKLETSVFTDIHRRTKGKHDRYELIKAE